MKQANIRTLDREAGALCRSRGSCERCESTEGLQAAHIVGRKIQATRWQSCNLVCLCWTCHAKFHDRPAAFGVWCQDYFTPAYLAVLHEMSHVLRPDIKPALEFKEVRGMLEAPMQVWYKRITGRDYPEGG